MFVVSCVLVIIVVESLNYVQKNTDTVYRGEKPIKQFFLCVTAKVMYHVLFFPPCRQFH